jgi:hypothetical protein
MAVYRLSSRLLLAAAIFCISTMARGQNTVPELPQDPANWINSPPISNKALEGKAAVLYFYEEG